MSQTSSSPSGIGFFGLLTIVFITLKLTHYVDWSWWWVLAPTWIPAVLWILLFLVAFTAYMMTPTPPKRPTRWG